MALVDFGNGIVVSTTDLPGILGQSGLDVPEFQVATTENSVTDGGTVGSCRTAMRRMTVRILHDREWTRTEIKQAFTTGVERTISSDFGSMPYYVEALTFPERLIRAEREFAVTIVSPLAYPEGDTLTAAFEGGTGSGWGADEVIAEHLTTDGYDQLTFLGAGTYEVGKGAVVLTDAAQRVTGVKVWISSAVAHNEWLFEARLHEGGLGGAVPSGSTLAIGQALVSTTTALTETLFTFDTPIELPAGYYAVDVYSLDAITWWNELRFATDSAKGYTDGAAYTAASDGVGVTYVADTTADLKFQLIGQSLDTGTGEVTFNADTDVPCAPVITCVIVTGDDQLVLTGADWTCTIAGPFLSEDIIMVDARNHTVTVNGSSAIADFDRTGDWPEVVPGSNTITIAPAAATTVQWQPRRTGLT